MKRIRNQSGFTLYELLLAIALMGVISTWAAVAFIRTSDIWANIRNKADLNSQADKAFETLAGDFSNVVSERLSGVPLTAEPDKNQSDTKDGKIADAIVIPVQVQEGGGTRMTTAAVRYGLDPKQHTLMRYSGSLTNTDPVGSPVPVAANIRGVCFEYTGGSSMDTWSPTWTGPNLPKAVRVSLLLVNPDRPGQAIARKAVFAIHVQ